MLPATARHPPAEESKFAGSISTLRRKLFLTFTKIHPVPEEMAIIRATVQIPGERVARYADELGRELLRQGGDDLHRLEADADHLADKANDVLGVVGPVGVGTDAAAGVLGDAVLVDDPLQGAAVAEPIVEHLRRNAGQ